MYRPELAVDIDCIIGEGPVWDERDQTLYFIDILGRSMHRFDGSRVERLLQFDQSIGFAVLRENGGVVAGLQDGFYFADPLTGKFENVGDPEPGRAEGRFNDGKVDPAGRVWGGTMPTSLDTGYGEAGPDSGLYCMDENRSIKTMLTGVIQGNGLAWSADTKKFYFIDTQRHCVQEFDYDISENVLSGGRVCVEVPASEGIPDGMTIDDDGKLWVALWGGRRVVRFDPATGSAVGQVELPALNVTSCCFGGKNLDELYITTGNLNTDRTEYPHAGSVFVVRPGITGAPSWRYRG